jgi:hypothetical protein
MQNSQDMSHHSHFLTLTLSWIAGDENGYLCATYKLRPQTGISAHTLTSVRGWRGQGLESALRGLLWKGS